MDKLMDIKNTFTTGLDASKMSVEQLIETGHRLAQIAILSGLEELAKNLGGEDKNITVLEAMRLVAGYQIELKRVVKSQSNSKH